MDALFDVVDAATHEEVEIDGSPDVVMAGSAVIVIPTPNGSAVPESRGGTGSAVIAIQSPNVDADGAVGTPTRWPQLKEVILTLVAGFGQPEFTPGDVRKYLDAAAKARIRPKAKWSDLAMLTYTNAVAERQRLFDQFQVAKAKGKAEEIGHLTLAVAEATHDEVTQLRAQNEMLLKKLDENSEMLKQVHATTVKGETPVDLSEQSASAQLAVNYMTTRVKQNQAKELRVHAAHERAETYDALREKTASSREALKVEEKKFRATNKEFNRQLTLAGQPASKMPKVSRRAIPRHPHLRAVNVNVNGLETFVVIVTPDLTTDALKDRIAEHLGDAAPATDAMKLKLGRKLLGAGTLGDAGVKDGASLTLVTS